MADGRRGRRFAVWLIGLGALGAGCLGLALGLGVRAASLFHEADEFYRGQDGSPIPDAVSRYYNGISTTSYAMVDLLPPLLAGAVLCTLGLLAVLALRWEGRNG